MERLRALWGRFRDWLATRRRRGDEGQAGKTDYTDNPSP
jgi:hypothetical protein